MRQWGLRKMLEWSAEASARPSRGSLVKLITKGGRTDFIAQLMT